MAKLDKNRIASSFSKAASTYDKAATFQREVGLSLLEMIDEKKMSSSSVLDLGCGTGFFSQMFKQRSPSAEVFALDLAQGMLTHAKEQRAAHQIHWLCADAENIPLADQSIDLIFSSLAIQWCTNLAKLFSQIDRVLAPGGSAFISTLGPLSLFELKQAWASVDEKTHVNQFVPLESLLQAIPDGLVVSASTKPWVLEYDKLQELTSDLKNIGAHNMNQGERKGLTGRAKITAFKNNYENFRRANGKLPSSYEVFFLQLNKRL